MKDCSWHNPPVVERLSEPRPCWNECADPREPPADVQRGARSWRQRSVRCLREMQGWSVSRRTLRGGKRQESMEGEGISGQKLAAVSSGFACCLLVRLLSTSCGSWRASVLPGTQASPPQKGSPAAAGSPLPLPARRWPTVLRAEPNHPARPGSQEVPTVVLCGFLPGRRVAADGCGSGKTNQHHRSYRMALSRRNLGVLLGFIFSGLRREER